MIHFSSLWSFFSCATTCLVLNREFFSVESMSFFCAFYHELFQFFANHRVKLSKDRNTSLIVFRRYQIQPLVQKQSFVVNIHLKANENFFRIPDPQFQWMSFYMNHMKNRFFPEVFFLRQLKIFWVLWFFCSRILSTLKNIWQFSH